MNKTIELELLPEEAYSEALLSQVIYDKLSLAPTGDKIVVPLRRSVDARGRSVVVRLLVDVVPKSEFVSGVSIKSTYREVSKSERVVIIGAGPAGLFAALRLIELGVKPIVVERGKDVRERRRDIAAINKEHIVNPESNYCFGEGGAGTYSDGKLYTRSKKRGDVKKILNVLVEHGAREEILFDAHPHIGTNKLPGIVTALRESVLAAGGEIHFNTKVVDILLDDGQVRGVVTNDGQKMEGKSVILATGHSARDIYELLDKKGVLLEAKPFALGVRVEHQQSLIDKIQYHCEVRDPFLPASSYALVNQSVVNGNQYGVFSFCMCPGGFIVPAATAPGEIVVNGMSPSRRDSRFANSGIVVAVQESDYKEYRRFGKLAGMHFQADIEKKAFELGGRTQTAPSQLLADFVEGRAGDRKLNTSYQPGLNPIDMTELLPSFITKSLILAFKSFGKKMRGYLTNEAQIVGVESRTSSPVRIPRDKNSFEHLQVKRLFPCGEGAGYAGGIVSAAMDGERCAEAAVKLYLTKK